jgi:predicted GIY-YIG superfamily endonuclease
MTNYDLYLIHLEEKKYYIGKTKDIKKRFNEHKEGNGSECKRKKY